MRYRIRGTSEGESGSSTATSAWPTDAVCQGGARAVAPAARRLQQQLGTTRQRQHSLQQVHSAQRLPADAR